VTKLQIFMRESGFKVLAMARFTQTEYGAVLYLLNCAASGLDQVITTESELAHLIGYEERGVHDALSNLASRNIIRLRYGEMTLSTENPSLSLAIQFDMRLWRLGNGEEVSSSDAIVYPFRRQGAANLQVFDGQKQSKPQPAKDGSTPTWQRVFNNYVLGRSLDDQELAQAEDVAKVLVETHPVDQVLLMVRHFGTRIPTLSLLASSWQHYQEVFENETHKVDMLEARQKHMELDGKLKEQARLLLDQAEQLELSSDELAVLQILVKHSHPRRQLFWAYQLRSRYPKLASFFADNAAVMLPVTSSGMIMKKPPL